MNDIIKCIESGDYAQFKAADQDRLFITVNAGRRGPYNPAN